MNDIRVWLWGLQLVWQNQLCFCLDRSSSKFLVLPQMCLLVFLALVVPFAGLFQTRSVGLDFVFKFVLRGKSLRGIAWTVRCCSGPDIL